MISKEVVAKAVIKEIKKENKVNNIETGLIRSYANPSKIVWKKSHSGYTPDIKAISAQGVPVIYEIELSESVNEEKWRLFSLYAAKSKGRFILVVPETRVKEMSELIKERNLRNIHFITFQV